MELILVEFHKNYDYLLMFNKPLPDLKILFINRWYYDLNFSNPQLWKILRFILFCLCHFWRRNLLENYMNSHLIKQYQMCDLFLNSWSYVMNCIYSATHGRSFFWVFFLRFMRYIPIGASYDPNFFTIVTNYVWTNF